MAGSREAHSRWAVTQFHNWVWKWDEIDKSSGLSLCLKRLCGEHSLSFSWHEPAQHEAVGYWESWPWAPFQGPQACGKLRKACRKLRGSCWTLGTSHSDLPGWTVWPSLQGQGQYPRGKWKNRSYQATEGPECPGSRKETHHLRLWSGRRGYLAAQDPEQGVERVSQLRVRPPGKSSFTGGLGQSEVSTRPGCRQTPVCSTGDCL